MADKEENSYEDIINQPHHISAAHPPVTMNQRASQFSPFIPQEGYDAAVRETSRMTDTKIELGEDLKELLNWKLNLLQKQEGHRPRVTVTYFQSDARKAGGAYVVSAGCIEKVGVSEGIIYIEDGTRIPIKDITEIEGEVFDGGCESHTPAGSTAWQE